MPKLSNIRKFDLFIFFTMFAKFSVELFMPIILYKLNYSINYILIYLLISFVFNIAISLLSTYIGKKKGYRYLLFGSAILFILLYLVVSFMKKNIFFFLLVCLLSSLTNTFYYIARHVYASSVLEKNKMGKGVGSILIATILASIASSILSALMLDSTSIIILAIVVTILYLGGVSFILFLPKTKKEHSISLRRINQKISLPNKIFFLLEQFKVIFFILYPLYVYIFVDNTYSYIGLLYVVTGLASIIFVFFFSSKIDHNKINYLQLSASLLAGILFLDMFIHNRFLYLVIVFIEGIAIKLYEVSVTNNMYKMQGTLEGGSYFLYMEILYNIGRFIIIFLMFLLKLKIRTVLYICILFIFISGFIKYKEPNN